MTRYLIFFETNNFDKDIYNDLKRVIKKQLLSRCFMVVINESVSKIKVKNISNKKIKEYDSGSFKNAIVRGSNCNFIESYAKGSPKGSRFSVFFRESMGKGFSLTDIDFVISNKSLLIEEKYFVEDENNGLLSEGQFYSIKELFQDCLNINIKYKIIGYNDGKYYLKDFGAIKKSLINHPKWGKMIKFKYDLCGLNAEQLIKNINNE